MRTRFGGAVDHLGRVVAVNWRSDLPALPPKKNYMAYMRMVNRLLPEHGLVLSDSYEDWRGLLE